MELEREYNHLDKAMVDMRGHILGLIGRNLAAPTFRNEG
jgi:hypothetical protein